MRNPKRDFKETFAFPVVCQDKYAKKYSLVLNVSRQIKAGKSCQHVETRCCNHTIFLCSHCHLTRKVTKRINNCLAPIGNGNQFYKIVYVNNRVRWPFARKFVVKHKYENLRSLDDFKTSQFLLKKIRYQREFRHLSREGSFYSITFKLIYL